MRRNVCIEEVKGREILDSRGNPTVEAEVLLSDGSFGRAAVPSGASTGTFEAVELRDNDKGRYLGNGVRRAVEHVNKDLRMTLAGRNPFHQMEIDSAMIAADGTVNKGNLGANAILAVSLANAKAAADSLNLPLYQYLGGINARTLPVPMMNIINGGKHADSSLNIQEFMIMPVSARSFQDALERCSVVFHTLKKLLKNDGYNTAVGDEGGFAPEFSCDEEAIQYLLAAVTQAGFKPGNDFYFAIDAAATEMYEEAKKIGKEGSYYFWKSDMLKSTDEMIEYWEDLCSRYPILSLEDGLAEEDWEGWAKLTKQMGHKVQLVGDDLFVTNTNRIMRGIKEEVSNSVLIKYNQIGTLTEALNAIEMTKNQNWTAIVSHRSGETEDVTLADVCVAVNAGQIKTGAVSRTDRVAKYNQLLRIEQDLKSNAYYPGRRAFKVLKG